jgi:excisionase family DNA binding protein
MEQKNLFSLKEAAAMLNVADKTLDRMASNGVIPASKVGGLWVFTRADLDKTRAQQQSPASAVRAAVGLPAGKTQPLPVMPLVANLLTPRRVKLDLRSTNRDGVLRELVALVIESHEKRSSDMLFEALKTREEMCPTCVNEGVAIPHARNALVGLVDRTVICYARSRRGVDFGSLDGQAIHHFFLLCAPNVREHLQALAQLARLMRDPMLRDRLASARSAASVITLIREAEYAVMR